MLSGLDFGLSDPAGRRELVPTRTGREADWTALAHRLRAACAEAIQAEVMSPARDADLERAELANWALQLSGRTSGGGCALTGGGTESNFLAMVAAKAAAGRAGGNVVLPASAHPSFWKAAGYLGLEVRTVALTARRTPSLRALEEAVDRDTVMIAASAPCWPYGVCDPLEPIAEIARRTGVWLHLDACIGGFLLPYQRDLGDRASAPDFGTSGLRSMAMDFHKFAYAPSPLSALVLRDEGDVALHRFDFDGWPGFPYATDGFGGAIGSASIIAAWAARRWLGDEGAISLAVRVRELGERLGGALEDRLLVAHPTAVMAVRCANADAERRRLRAQGYRVNVCSRPSALHFYIDPLRSDAYYDALIGELRRLDGADG